ncbi:MAG: aspartate/glutamate racemase family protein [Actinobacteria bacterium]|jgi:aspartate racemase|nr:MAG: aspartate/glutamate racemase family protein [Actinomycetota bacterium]
MKTIGLIGGMSWESTAEYYRIINQAVKEKRGGHHSARLVLYSVDFEEIEDLQHRDGWEELTQLMIDAARRVQGAGADFLLICTNTMHVMAGEVEESLDIPLLHIADATAQEIKGQGLTRVGLLGTRFTMEQDFYRGRLEGAYGIEVLVPGEDDRRAIHAIIYDELCHGIAKAASRELFMRVMDDLVALGARGIVLGCTEIPLLIGQNDVGVPVFDTTRIHALAAVERAVKG